MYDNPNYTKFVNATYSKPFSPRQVLPNYVMKYAKKTDKILDYGAGRDIFGTKILRDNGYDCAAWEIGDNFSKELHDYHALERTYNIVFASNVLNVQPSISDAIDIVGDMDSLLKNKGYFFCNLPPKPRHNDMTDEMLESVLKLEFNQWGKNDELVEKIAPHVWKCQVMEWRI